jgi:hypothetical protein
MPDFAQPQDLTEAELRAALLREAKRQTEALEALQALLFRFLKDWTEHNA